ncbi:SDR family NAD(P)-dependent oxidoreductase [Mycolicibacterium baixiangningiae]|uniref:SDR family NAD(P)-dependent oxidoreductase n=1 Tax=Mycolicibacterium baixiangningiae TaxID=2761578 RepID=UPI001867DE4A|nr:SDR family oxidoreductase [Mycolicibacterium baixiangningiae]
MARLDDKIALVIGGASGIGYAISERFAAEGAETYLTSRSKSSLDEAVERIGARAHAVPIDASQLDGLEVGIESVRAQAGRIDVLVVNAGTGEPGGIGEITEDNFDRTVGLNLRSLLFAVQLALPLMGPGGSIVLIGSCSDEMGFPGLGVYAATKAAVRSLARTWTLELAPRAIRVNVISPGPTDTPMHRSAPEEVRQWLISKVPLGRAGRPEEIAAAALFLASDESSYVAGTSLSVDGGMAQV